MSALGILAAGRGGLAFYILGAILVGILVFSLWRLRRRSSGPDT